MIRRCCGGVIGSHGISPIICGGRCRGRGSPSVKSPVFCISGIVEPTSWAFSTFGHFDQCTTKGFAVFFNSLFFHSTNLLSRHWIYSYYLKPFSRRDFQATAQLLTGRSFLLGAQSMHMSRIIWGGKIESQTCVFGIFALAFIFATLRTDLASLIGIFECGYSTM